MALKSELLRSLPFRASYASFAQRLVATVFDLYLITLGLFGTLTFVALTKKMTILEILPRVELGRVSIESYSSELMKVAWLVVLVSYVPVLTLILYSTILERTPPRATIGKMLMGLRVVTPYSYHVRFGALLRRNIFKMFPWFIFTTLILLSLFLNQSLPELDDYMASIFFGITFGSALYAVLSLFVPFFTRNGLAVHDSLTETIVLNDADSPRDRAIFVTMVTLLLTLIFAVNSGRSLAFIEEALNRHGSKISLELPDLVLPRSVDNSAKKAKKEKAIIAPERSFPSLPQQQAIETLKKGEALAKEGRVREQRITATGPVTSTKVKGQVTIGRNGYYLAKVRVSLVNSNKTAKLLFYRQTEDDAYATTPIMKVHIHFNSARSRCVPGDLKSYLVQIYNEEIEPNTKYVRIARNAGDVIANNYFELKCDKKSGGWIRMILDGEHAELHKGKRVAFKWELNMAAPIR